MNSWFIKDDDGNISLTWFGYNEYNVQVSTIAEDMLDMIMLTLKEGSDTATYCMYDMYGVVRMDDIGYTG